MARKNKRQKVTRRGKDSSSAQNTNNRSTSTIRKGAARVEPSFAWTPRTFKALSEKDQNTYFRAKRVIKEIRSGKSASQAARDNKTTLSTVPPYFPAAFIKSAT